MRVIEVTGNPEQIDWILSKVTNDRESFIVAHNGIEKAIIEPILEAEEEGPDIPENHERSL
jgi:hypothetical protein